ncbi:MAG: MFS transporter, partial [Anaerolineae bacterium]|nr:MFS transporter [Anaerolineae bacterium]
AWLPGTLYLHTYADASTRLVAAFEEDVDVTTTSAPGGRLEGRGLSIWREERVAMRRGRMDENSAVLLGWLGQEDAARYTLWLPGPIPGAGPESVLTFSLADANLSPDPTAGDKEHDSEESPALRDFTLEAEDREGQTARLPLSAFAPLQPQIEVQLLKAAFMTDLPRGEIVFQSYAFPLSAFAEVNPALDAAQLAAIHFIFDRSEEGVIVLDDIGFRDARLFAVEGE